MVSEDKTVFFIMIRIQNFQFIALLVLSTLLVNCSHCDVSEDNSLKNDTNRKSLAEIASEKFGGKYSLIPNSSNTYVICLKAQKGALSSPVVEEKSFFIFDKINSEVIFEDNLSNVSLKWSSSEVVSITRAAGMIKKNSDSPAEHTVYNYNVIERKKYFR
jgi:hypothetical protein